MTHELKHLLQVAYAWHLEGKRSVMATVVELEGSSYRRPGVRMLIGESGEIIGAVSGGCVEKEVQIQAASVFKTSLPKVMTYDGRFRLGCEGVLYILLEPIEISEALIEVANSCFESRVPFKSESFYKAEFSESNYYGTILNFEGQSYSFRPEYDSKHNEHLSKFHQDFPPIFQLYIFGAEHDAVHLCKLASHLGWDVHIIAAPDEQKSIDYFEGAKSLSSPIIDNIDVSEIGENSAVVLMSHSLNKDVQYMMALRNTKLNYIGLLGSKKRRERIFSEILNYYPDTPLEFFESVYGPAGLNIAAETPAEIALSILSEILSVSRNAEVMPLREKSGSVHG